MSAVLSSPSPSTLDQLELLVEMLPEAVGQIVSGYQDEIEEITLDIGRPPTVTLSGRRWRRSR
jgi:stage III sporulation protein SpoIIIAA